jgi:hypothetical protein
VASPKTVVHSLNLKLVLITLSDYASYIAGAELCVDGGLRQV